MIYFRRIFTFIASRSCLLVATACIVAPGCVAGPVDTSELVSGQQDNNSSTLPALPPGYDEPPKSSCVVNVVGIGKKLIELDYLPNVLQCEHGDDYVPLAALQAQAVAARTYLYVRTRGGAFPICNTYLCQVAYCNKPPLLVTDAKLWVGNRVPAITPKKISDVELNLVKPQYRRFFEAVQSTEAMVLMGVPDSSTDVRVRKYYNAYYADANDFTGGTAYTEYTQGDEACSQCSNDSELDPSRNWSQCLRAYAFPSGQVDRKRDGHMGQHNASCRARLLNEDFRALLAFYYSRDAALAWWGADCADSKMTAGYVDYSMQ